MTFRRRVLKAWNTRRNRAAAEQAVHRQNSSGRSKQMRLIISGNIAPSEITEFNQKKKKTHLHSCVLYFTP
jgi:P2-related tail formation protein